MSAHSLGQVFCTLRSKRLKSKRKWMHGDKHTEKAHKGTLKRELFARNFRRRLVAALFKLR